jgi:hypothetical protein
MGLTGKKKFIPRAALLILGLFIYSGTLRAPLVFDDIFVFDDIIEIIEDALWLEEQRGQWGHEGERGWAWDGRGH